MYPDPKTVTRVTTLGAGPIGGGWAAHFLARGYDVTAYIHAEAETAALMSVINTGWISLQALGLAPGASLDRLRITTDLADAVKDAQFIQESAPERLDIKQALYKRLGELAPRNCVIASSTSGLMMTQIQADCPTPERTVIGHPFNPPYLLPLVEVVGGKATAPARPSQSFRATPRLGSSPSCPIASSPKVAEPSYSSARCTVSSPSTPRRAMQSNVSRPSGACKPNNQGQGNTASKSAATVGPRL